MTNTHKDLWRERWLGCINELTSPGLQKRTWLDNTNTNPHWSFVEFMCCYFDDLAIDDNYKGPLEEGLLTRIEFEIIRDWHNALDKYDSPNNDDYDPEAILSDTKWLEILQLGLQAKNALAGVLNQREKEILLNE